MREVLSDNSQTIRYKKLHGKDKNRYPNCLVEETYFNGRFEGGLS